MDSQYPLITIGVSAYNRKDYLRLCLDSLLAQTYPNCEIIVVDDGSADGTEEMMAAEYPQVRYIYQENAGDAAAKNHAAREASGSYVVFNDSDDLFLPDTVERLYDALRDDPGSCSYGTYRTIDETGTPLPTKKKVSTYPSGIITGDLLRHIIVNNCGTLIPLELYRENGGFDTGLKVSYDYKFFLQLSLKCRFHAVQEPVFLRRRHGGNLSSATFAKMKMAWEVFDGFVAAHPELDQRYAAIIRSRRADFHNKLCREALREKLKKEARFHAGASFRARPGLKSLFRLLQAAVS